MYPITSRFNDFEHFRTFPHKGIDFAMKKGTELKAIVDGKIMILDYGNLKSGKTVVIKGEDGQTYIYGHLSEFNVKTGDVVHQGDLLGLSGNSGNVFGSGGGYHLDFSVKNAEGQFIDPAPYTDFIQNMNDSKYMESLLADTVQSINDNAFSFDNVMEKFTETLSNINFGSFGDFTLNTISVLFKSLLNRLLDIHTMHPELNVTLSSSHLLPFFF